jgi:hypothetical protein
MFEAANGFMDAFTKVCKGEKGIVQALLNDYYNRSCPHNGQIELSWSENKIERFIRAMIYPPLPVAKCGKSTIHSVEEFKSWKNRQNKIE